MAETLLAKASRALKRNASRETEEAQPPKESKKEAEAEADSSSDMDADAFAEAPAWAKQMTRGMEKMLKQMSNVNIKVDEAVNTSKEAKTAVEHLQVDMNNLKDDYVAFQAGVGATVTDIVRKEIDKAMGAQPQRRAGNGDSEAEDENPERLVIVSGWPQDTPEEDITTALQKFV